MTDSSDDNDDITVCHIVRGWVDGAEYGLIITALLRIETPRTQEEKLVAMYNRNPALSL
jgi:hypothetical protein